MNRPIFHTNMLTMGVSMWTLFLILGLDSEYFLKWSWYAQLILIVILPTIILAFITSRKIRKLNRRDAQMQLIWTAVYFTVPFFILDVIYLGLHQNLGANFLRTHWYLTAFYVTPWLIVPLLLYCHPILSAKTKHRP